MTLLLPAGGDVMHLATYIGMLHQSEQTLADSFHTVGAEHAAEADVPHICLTLAAMSEEHVRLLSPIAARYGEQTAGEDLQEPARLHADGVAEGRTGALGLLRDLQDLYMLAALVQTTWTVVFQAAQALRDQELQKAAEIANDDTSRQMAWLNTRLKAAAPQALLVAS
jgi:hypothetical protein